MTPARTRRLATWCAAIAIVTAAAWYFRADLWISGLVAGPPTTAPSLGQAGGPATGPATRPANWAQPLTAGGVGNFYRVSDGLYRGQQPTAEGFVELKKLGIKTVVDLRYLHSDAKLLGDTGLAYKGIEFDTFVPRDAQVAEFLKIVSDKANQPVFVHCQHGADRTGMMCAMYRMAVEGWAKDDAMREMTEGGYGWHPFWKNILAYMRKVNMADIKKQAGLGE